MSPAAQSDDFGEFEEADMEISDENNASAENIQPMLHPQAVSVAQHLLSNAAPATSKPMPSASALQDKLTADIPAGAKPLPSSLLPDDLEEEEPEDEVPWYVDPETYKRSRSGAAKGHGKQISTSDLPVQQTAAQKPISHSQPPQRQQPQPQQPLHFPEALLASGHPQSILREQQVRQSPAWSLPVRHNHLPQARPEYYEAAADPKPSLPLPLLHDLERVSTSPRAAQLHFPTHPTQHADMLAEARATPLRAAGRSVAEQLNPHHWQDLALQQQLIQQQIMQQQALHQGPVTGQQVESQFMPELVAQEKTEPEGWRPPLRSYSEAWTQMVEVRISSALREEPQHDECLAHCPFGDKHYAGLPALHRLS